tara:strand:+ start:669 stop:887 length:219 start_codon:yes stop_codon:yes gene_type:complete
MTDTVEDEHTYRWLLINNQETCFLCIIKLIDGYYASAKEAQRACPEYNFKESLFSVLKIGVSCAPKSWVNQN